MAIVSATTVKSYFETGDKPTQSQFEDFIDTALRDTLIAIATAGEGGSTGVLEVTGTAAVTAHPMQRFLVLQGASAAAVDASARTVQDGGGQALPMAVSTSAVSMTAQLAVAGTITGAGVAALLKGQISGLTLSNNSSDSDHDIDIAAGAVGDTTQAEIMHLSASITKQIDAAWAVGSGAGGLDTGAVAASTLYAVHLIRRSDTGVVDALFSTAFDKASVTLPTDYDQSQLIGAVATDSSSNIAAFVQSGDYFRFTADQWSDVNDATITDDTFETGTLTVPPDCLAHIYAGVNNTSETTDFMALYRLSIVTGKQK